MAEEETKATKDYSAIVAVRIPEIVDPVAADSSKLDDAIAKLLALEKKTRLSGDGDSTLKLCTAVLTLLYNAKKWVPLAEHVTMLCKRRAQHSKTLRVIIQTAAAWIDDTPDKATKKAYIEALRVVSEGKIFVELERARMTRTLASMQEEEGDIDSAAKVLEAVQVETIGSMEVREKADFLMEQMRLLLAKKDYLRAEIISKKVNVRVLEKADHADLKLRFYRLMIQYHEHSGNFLETCKAFQAIFRTKEVQDVDTDWKDALRNAVMFAVLSEWDGELSDILHRLKTEPKLRFLPTEQAILTLFTTRELIKWPVTFSADFATHSETLHNRTTQHNIRVVAEYYTCISLDRLAALLALEGPKSERMLAEMVSSKQLVARINRPAGKVTFVVEKGPGAVLDTWSSDVESLLKLVDETCYLINKENMVHKISA